MARYIENFFDKFFEHRDYLNRQFHQGDITKKEYIEQSYYYLTDMGQKPYKIVDNKFKALYNYQYYNMTAKFYQLRLREMVKYGKHPEKEKELSAKIQGYYYNKDRSTIKLLELLDYNDVHGYFIRVKSKELRNKLFEIVITSDDLTAVLHSVNPVIAERLIEHNVFDKKSRKSEIDGYINSRY